jgi:outer membrane protein assembly factor BamD
MRLRSLLLCIALLVSLLGFGQGCSSGAISDNDPAQLYKEAEEDIQSDHFQLALDKLRLVKNKYPYSKFAVDAQLRIADVLYLQESFAEAAAAYELFRDLHPKHEKTPYAMFRVGMSYYSDMPSTVARDLTPATRALEAFMEFVRRFPSAAEAPEANTHIAETRKFLADKELYIGDFYVRRDEFDSARARYSKVVSLYPETDTAREAEKKLQAIAGKTKK